MDQIQMLRIVKTLPLEEFTVEIVKLRRQKVEKLKRQKTKRLKRQKLEILKRPEIKNLTSNELLTKLLILLAQIKAVNNSCKHNKITKTLSNNSIKSL